MASSRTDTSFPLHRAVCLVTGADRGTGRGAGRAFVRELPACAARPVYAGARNPGKVGDPDVAPQPLGVTDAEQISSAAGLCGGADLPVNNAGVLHAAFLLGAPPIQGAREEIETKAFGMRRGAAPTDPGTSPVAPAGLRSTVGGRET